MAAKKPVEEFEGQMIEEDTLTTVVQQHDDSYKGPTVSVFIPAIEDSGSRGIKVDQYEHVTIANEFKENTYYIHRGEHVEVPVPVFMVLKERYPNI